MYKNDHIIDIYVNTESTAFTFLKTTYLFWRMCTFQRLTCVLSHQDFSTYIANLNLVY